MLVENPVSRQRWCLNLAPSFRISTFGLRISHRVHSPFGNSSGDGKRRNMIPKRFDVRRIRKLAEREKYAELYFYWRESEQMIASNFPQARRHGRRLKKRVENLYSNWFGSLGG